MLSENKPSSIYIYIYSIKLMSTMSGRPCLVWLPCIAEPTSLILIDLETLSNAMPTVLLLLKKHARLNTIRSSTIILLTT